MHTPRKRRRISRPAKRDDILEKIRFAIKTRNFRDTRHSIAQGIERSIDLLDIIEVLGTTGYHEKRKDEYREDFKSWNYAIRGKTFEGKELRIAVYFEVDLVMIATVIDLSPN
jgi:hypothetical protein